jgi:TonB family protein
VRASLSVLAACVSLSGVAAAETTPPNWLRKPTTQELYGVWPLAAKTKGVDGGATISCVVTEQGLLTDCTVVSEHPAGMGFGAAAIALSDRFLMTPAKVDGKPIPSRATIPVNFRDDSGPPTARTGTRFVTPPESILMLTNPVWLSAPSFQQMANAYPSLDPGKAVAGHVVMQCHVAKDGSLHFCDIMSEQPGGRGFGKAARSVAPFFRADLSQAPPGKIDQIRINLPIHFETPQDASASRTLSEYAWTRTPAPELLGKSFPDAAAKAGATTGRAVLSCSADAHGALAGCLVLSETPPGLDFGSSALKVAEGMSINPWTTEGLPVDGAHVKFAIRLNRPDQTAQAQPPPAVGAPKAR